MARQRVGRHIDRHLADLKRPSNSWLFDRKKPSPIFPTATSKTRILAESRDTRPSLISSARASATTQAHLSRSLFDDASSRSRYPEVAAPRRPITSRARTSNGVMRPAVSRYNLTASSGEAARIESARASPPSRRNPSSPDGRLRSQPWARKAMTATTLTTNALGVVRIHHISRCSAQRHASVRRWLLP